MAEIIPFNRPGLAGDELKYIAEAIRREKISGDGHFSKECQALLERELGAARVFLTTSCTDALELAGLLIDLQPGDEVIVPSFTFVSTANAFALRGARPVFVDIRADTLNLDESKLEAAIGSRTRAIVPVHYAGVGCEMDRVGEIAKRRNLVVIEDNAHGLFARYRGKPLGSFGALATQSFHETKNFSCGEGGALVINDARYIERAEILREKGTNRSRFFRGQVDKYSWVDLGSSFLPSDMLGAFLFAQLEQREAIQARRRRVWEHYGATLGEWARARGFGVPVVPAGCEQSFHMFYLILPSLKVRTAFIDHLKARGVNAVFHYQPLHLSEMGRRFGGVAGQCPVTEDLADRIVRLPFYNDLTPAELARVTEAARAF